MRVTPVVRSHRAGFAEWSNSDDKEGEAPFRNIALQPMGSLIKYFLALLLAAAGCASLEVAALAGSVCRGPLTLEK